MKLQAGLLRFFQAGAAEQAQHRPMTAVSRTLAIREASSLKPHISELENRYWNTTRLRKAAGAAAGQQQRFLLRR